MGTWVRTTIFRLVNCVHQHLILIFFFFSVAPIFVSSSNCLTIHLHAQPSICFIICFTLRCTLLCHFCLFRQSLRKTFSCFMKRKKKVFFFLSFFFFFSSMCQHGCVFLECFCLPSEIFVSKINYIGWEVELENWLHQVGCITKEKRWNAGSGIEWQIDEQSQLFQILSASKSIQSKWIETISVQIIIIKGKRKQK